MKKYFLILFIPAFLLLLLNCPPPADMPPVNTPPADTPPVNTSQVYTVGNVSATCMEFPDFIRISWYDDLFIGASGTGSYKIYRYPAATSSHDAVFTEVTTTFFDDASVLNDKIYYYKVCCVVNKVEYHLSPGWALGLITGLGSDNFEPNDDYNPELAIDEARRVGIVEETALIYYLSDGNGWYEEDSDWYFYDNSGAADVRICVTPHTQALAGNLELVLPGRQEGIVLNSGINIVPAGTDAFHFCIRFNGVGYEDTVGSYSLRIVSH